MGVEVEIIQPERHQVEPAQLESSDSVQTGNPVAPYAAGVVALILALALLITFGDSDDQPVIEEQSTTTLAPRNTDGDRLSANNEPDGAHDAELQSRRTSITEWPGGQSLIIVENPQFIYELDLATGRRTSWSPPELLLDTDPLVVGEQVVVVGESGAWIGTPFAADWRFLAKANRVMPSTRDGRFWLQNNIPVSDSLAANFEWKEMDAAGNISRTMLRDLPVELATPEVSISSDGGIQHLTDGNNTWRTVSSSGQIIASGVHDMVALVCDSQESCERIWYEPATFAPKAGFYPDLAENIEAGFGALLSPDGRFVASRISPDSFDVAITSVVTGREIDNSCMWGEALVWSDGSEVLACTISSGTELFRTEDGVSLGRAINTPNAWSRMAFIPTVRGQ